MKKLMRRCRHCGCLFEVCNKVKKHEYCNKKKCQRARKRKWQKDKLKNDPTYRKDQKAAQEDWLNNNPDYWKNYRHNNKEYTDRNREKQGLRDKIKRSVSTQKADLKPLAKMDALTRENKIISGRYELTPITSDMIAKMDVLIVEISAISSGYTHSGP